MNEHLLKRFDDFICENLSEIARLMENEKRLMSEIQELTKENANVRLRLKQAESIAEQTAQKFVTAERNLMDKLVYASHIQTADCEIATLSTNYRELQRENSIYKTEIDKLNSTLRSQNLKRKLLDSVNDVSNTK